MKLHQRAAAVLMACALALTVSACSGGSTPSSSSSNSASSSKPTSSSSQPASSSKPASSSQPSSSSSTPTKATYTVTVKANSDSYGTVTGGGSFTDGTKVTVKATPKTGYVFKGWQKDGSIISPDTAYSFTVMSDCALTAMFEAQPVKKIIWATTTDSNGVTTLTGYNESGAIPSGDLVIPSQVGGKAISKIGDNFLKENKYITSVTIPGTIESVGASAFYGCVNLKTVIVQEGVTAIYENAFQNCVSLVTVSLPKTLTKLGHWDSDTGWNNVFAGCTSLKQIRLPSNLTCIAACNFEGCTSLEKVYIPASVTVIYSSAFKDCRSLSAVYYGGDATDWGKVVVDSGNDYLSSVENVYFNQTGF